MESSTTTTTADGALTLRAWPNGDRNAQLSLSKLIERINAQEGSFRNVTEEALEEAVRRAGPETQLSPNKDGNEAEETDEKSQREKVLEAKGDIIKLATEAWTESSHTLDFISLVVSQFNPKAAEYTMTPFIKQTLPSGSLGAEVLEVPRETDSMKLANDLTSFGWKLESLSASADSLLRSATSLEKEMEKEARYWDDVLAVKKSGWSLCTLPRERHTLGVRYGFLETGPEFRDRGLAALCRGEDGKVDLDLGTTFPTARSLRVQIKAMGEVVASTSESPSQPDSLELSIQQARNHLFDEELYHEMSREARPLTNRGVKCVGDDIVIPLAGEADIFVTLVDEDEASSSSMYVTSKSDEYRDLPAFVLVSFRLLLSHYHRQHYLRRTELPPPLKKRKQHRPLPAIIQPILSHFEHRSYLQKLETHLNALTAILRNAGVAWNISPVESNLRLDRLLQAKDLDQADFAHAFMEMLCSPLQSSIRIECGTDGTAFNVSVRTHSSGTEFRVTKSSPDVATALAQTPEEMRFSDLPALAKHLSHLAVLHLVDIAAAQNERWQATDPDEGELTTVPTLEGEVETLSITLEHGQLELAWRSSHLDESARTSVEWRGGDAAPEPATSFAEEVGRLSSRRAAAA